MEYKIENEKLEDLFEMFDELEGLLNERIEDLYEVRGGIQARHSYIYYRSLLLEAKYFMRDNLKEIKPKQ